MFFGLSGWTAMRAAERQAELNRNQAISDVVGENKRLREALNLTISRLQDASDVLDERGSLSSVFLRATARRCQFVLNGGTFHDSEFVGEYDYQKENRQRRTGDNV